MIQDHSQNPRAITKESAAATRWLFDVLFGDEADNVGRELCAAPLDPDDSKAGRFLNGLAEAYHGLDAYEKATETPL